MIKDYCLVPFYSLFSLGRGLNITKSDYVENGYPCLSYGDVHSRFKGFVNASRDNLPKVDFKFLKSNPLALLNEGDIVFADTSEDYEGSGDSTCVLECNSIFFAGYHTTIARPRSRLKVYSPYFGYYFQSEHFRGQLKKRVSGVKVYSITNRVLNSTRVLLPNLEEQKNIASILNERLRSIDLVLARLLTIDERLKDYRRYLIFNAVTKGLGKKSISKDSGISWIGKIPGDWVLAKLGNVGSFCSGSVFPEHLQGSLEKELAFFKVADMSRSEDQLHMPSPLHTIDRQTMENIGARVISSNSIVYAKIGAASLLNKRRIVAKECCIDNNMTAFTPKGVSLKWAFYWLCVVDFGLFSCPATVPSLSEGRQSRIPILIPPVEDQMRVTNFLDEQEKLLISIDRKIKGQIRRLKDLRKAIIDEAFGFF